MLHPPRSWLAVPEAFCLEMGSGCVQGLMLLSPSIDVPRTVVLRAMAAVQGFLVAVAPYWRVVPRPTLEMVTADPQVVSAPYPDPLHPFRLWTDFSKQLSLALVQPPICVTVTACVCADQSQDWLEAWLGIMQARSLAHTLLYTAGQGRLRQWYNCHPQCFRASCCALQRAELGADPFMDLAKLRVRTGRSFLDGFKQIREMQGHVSLPIFAAMSPTDEARPHASS